MKKLLISICCCLTAGSSMAALQVGSTQFEDKLTKEGTELVLNGAGLREIFFVDVYSAGLYLTQKSNDANTVITMKGPKSVRLVLERDVDAADFVEALNDGITDNTTEKEREELKTELQSLIAVMNLIGDVKKGDQVDFDFTNKHATSVSVNGKLIGEKIGGLKLYQAVLKIWLGDKPIDSGLKADLLK